MPKLLKLDGQVFGRLTVISLAPPPNGVRYAKCRLWNVRCECGVEKTVEADRLATGHTRSCGCLRSDTIAATNFRHGETSTRINGARCTAEYRAWLNMIRRCSAETSKDWETHGGRGIRVCDRWLERFENFRADMGERPSAKHSLDRIDNERGYSPENCRWATQTQQAQNTRKNVYFEYKGERVCLAELARRVGVDSETLSARLKRGWSFDRAITPRVKGAA